MRAVIGRPHVGLSGEDGLHLCRNRQLDAVARAERQRGAGRAHALSHHFHPGQDLRQRPATRELDADVTVPAQRARASQHEIAKAAQPGQRLAPPAGGAGERASARQDRA